MLDFSFLRAIEGVNNSSGILKIDAQNLAQLPRGLLPGYKAL